MARQSLPLGLRQGAMELLHGLVHMLATEPGTRSDGGTCGLRAQHEHPPRCLLENDLGAAQQELACAAGGQVGLADGHLLSQAQRIRGCRATRNHRLAAGGGKRLDDLLGLRIAWAGR